MKDMWTAPPEVKGFWTMIAGTIVQLFSAAQNLSLMQVMGFLVAVAGLIVQISAYFKNRAETRRAEAEEQRSREKHEAEMYFARRKIEQLERNDKL